MCTLHHCMRGLLAQQHHLFLADNAKTLVVILPNYPKCNLFFVTLAFVWLSSHLFRITMRLRFKLVPDDTAVAARIALALAGATAGFAVIAACVRTLPLWSLIAVGAMIGLTAAGLYAKFQQQVKGKLWVRARSALTVADLCSRDACRCSLCCAFTDVR